ncbi:MAG: hypothetical protein LCH84_15430 [Gemmatimonadetes bacterium]|nr:hypothetical protein [Gemmatimonadota bacterium]
MKRAAAVVAMAGLVAGCYATHPVAGTAVPLGNVVVLTVTDQGRAVLEPQMGPSIESIEGRLTARDSASYTLSVTATQLLRGGQQVWTGERIRIRSEHVALVSEKKFSRSRTAIVSAATIAVIVGVAKGGLAGLLQGDEGKLPSDSAISVRIPRP